MIIDMHVHTVLSGDSSATVEDYCRIIRQFREYHPFDAIVLTEHRAYQQDDAYRQIGEEYGVLVLQGIEVNTDLGHLLLYGVTDGFLDRVDISRLGLKCHEVIEEMERCGGVAVPAHPFRESSYGKALVRKEERLDGIAIIEERNGSNTTKQNDQASDLVRGNGLKGIGGSDAHYVNRHWFLNCATQFDAPITTMASLVEALKSGSFQPIVLDKSPLGEF